MPYVVDPLAAEAESYLNFGVAILGGRRGHLLLLMGRGKVGHLWMEGLLGCLRGESIEEVADTLVAVVEMEASWLVAATEQYMLVEAA